MSLFFGTERIAGHSQTTTPIDNISNQSVSFNDDGNIEGYSSYDEISSELTDNSMLGSLIGSLKRGGLYLKNKIENINQQISIINSLLNLKTHDVIYNQGNIEAVYQNYTTFCPITLKANSKYLVLARLGINIGAQCLTALTISKESGSAKFDVGGDTVRTYSSSGAGCVNWKYIETNTEVVLKVNTYGYLNDSYIFNAQIIAICLH